MNKIGGEGGWEASVGKVGREGGEASVGKVWRLV